MSMHKVELPSDGTIVNLFTGAVPPIAPGSAVYIQNITTKDAMLSDTNDLSVALFITAIGTATSTISISAGEDAYLKAENDSVTLTCQVV